VRDLIEELDADTAGRIITWKIAELPEADGDPAMLRIVFQNLLSNAVKYTRTRAAAEIEVGSAGDEHEHVFFVRDNGVGFDMRYADKLFGVFQRLHRADQFEGSGVGLATVQRIIHKHGGKIWVESELGQGSTFCFVIPKEQPSEAVHVLVVDDDARMLELMRRALERQGFQVTTAEDGTVALETMRHELPEVVITDLEMPNTDGVETLRQIRQDWGLLPVIILTGFPDAEILRRAMEFSPFTLLAKPCPTEQLIETIRSLCLQKTSRGASTAGDRQLRSSTQTVEATLYS